MSGVVWRDAIWRWHGGSIKYMGLRLRRFALLVSALSVMLVALVGCQTTGVVATGGSGGSKAINIITPPAASPTPTFPVFTIGAWPSNFSPGNPDTITIYALTRVQDPTMMNPAKPPSPGVTVTFLIGAPINQSATATTGPDGIATTQIAFSDPNPGTPVVVTVTASYNSQQFSNETFFTPGATFTPTPGPGTPGAGTPGAGTPTP